MKFQFFFVITFIYISVAQTEKSSPYILHVRTDGITIGAGLVVALSASIVDHNLRKPTLAEISSLKKDDVNIIERFATENYSKAQSTASDVALFLAFGTPLALLADSSIRSDVGTIVTMYIEMGLFSNFLPSYGKRVAQRFRPYVYGSSASLNEKLDKDASRSFFSGHTTRAFAAAVMTSIMYEDYFPESDYRIHVWCTSLALASSCALLRVTSGYHFPTDVIAGAVVGSGIGYLIPYIHRTKPQEISLTPAVSPLGNSITLTLRF
jgi:membrane-associated phospholipid phosphatase